jgi:hypothetical protein
VPLRFTQRRIFVAIAALLSLSALSACGGGGGSGGGKVVVEATPELTSWVQRWSGEIDVSTSRLRLVHIPPPPTVSLPSRAEQIGTQADQSAGSLSTLLQEGYAETKGVFCTWFGFYVQTGETVPTEDEFIPLLLEYGFGRVLTAPPSVQLRSAIGSFQDAILAAQSEEEAERNAAIAAVCAAPNP